ncbi:MAG: ATP-dependent helicase HrpB, partial [Syntrophales bacterium]|nr:ATP-dependent helicase HrpB [Syntrophales bacterium]
MNENVRTFPIDGIIPELKAAFARCPAVVLQAPPGSGKTTRVPIAFLEAIPPEKGRIIMIEPRRIAAVAAARWMARTLGEEIGQKIGYSIRFDSRVSQNTRIEVVTEGILTRRMLADPALTDVAMIIFDEFHERSLQTDLALAMCLDISKGFREGLKILVMSATMDCGPISALLGNAPVISAGGEAFPVKEHYYEENGRAGVMEERIAGAVRVALRGTSGDLLVFLPGAGEIRRTAERLASMGEDSREGISIHPLYGDLPFEEQERAILPSRKRKVVLATNIAETSLTIEGVTTVIDSGLTRRLQYDPTAGMNRLITVPVSRASAEQRKGRAGRLGPGFCYRLYSRYAYESMIPYAPPEILVSDLSSLVLDMAVWGVKDPQIFSWLDPPPERAWEAAKRLLFDLGALDAKGLVTQAGRSMARLPLHPRLGRLLLRASEIGCLHLGVDLAAILAERDVLRRGAVDDVNHSGGADISERLDLLRQWRREKRPPGDADPWAVRAVDRVSGQLLHLMTGDRKRPSLYDADDLIPCLL